MILKTSSHLVQIKVSRDSYVLYHSLFGRPVVVSKASVDLIKRFRNGASIAAALTKEEITKFKSSLTESRQRRFLVGKGTDEYAILNRLYAPRRKKLNSWLGQGRPIGELRLEMASFCNFSCPHCLARKLYDWNKDSLMSFETAKRAFDGFLWILQRNNANHGKIVFWGGEPLLNWKVARQVVRYVEKTVRGTPVSIDMGFVTNGSLINDRVAGFIKDHSLSATISLDGLEKDNDRFRRYVNGRGTFKSIRKGMDSLFKHGVPFWVETTLNDYNFYNVEKMIGLIHEKYNANVFIVFPASYQCSQTDFDHHSPQEKAKRVVEIYRYGLKKHLSITIEHLYLVNAMVEGRPHLFACTGKAAILYVKPNGLIYPCQEICTPIGDVRRIRKVVEDDNYKRVARRGVDRLAGCRGCTIEGFCAGGCAALAQFYSGDIYNTSDQRFQAFHCEYRRHLVKEMLRYLSCRESM